MRQRRFRSAFLITPTPTAHILATILSRCTVSLYCLSSPLPPRSYFGTIWNIVDVLLFLLVLLTAILRIVYERITVVEFDAQVRETRETRETRNERQAYMSIRRTRDIGSYLETCTRVLVSNSRVPCTVSLCDCSFTLNPLH